MLKTKLKQMKQSTKPLIFSDELLAEMLANIGSIDAELRDGLIYHLFCQGVSTGAITKNQQKMLVIDVLEKKLVLNQISESNNDMVFTRSFAVLLMALLVFSDQQQQFLNKAEFCELQVLACEYIRTEVDTRGFITEKGWAHGLAHGGDLLLAIVTHPYFEPASTSNILASLESTIFRQTEKFADLEEDRLSQVVSGLLNGHSSQIQTISRWIQKMAEQLALFPGKEHWEDSYYHCYQKYYQFMQALYFQLLIANQRPPLNLIADLQQLIAEKYT